MLKKIISEVNDYTLHLKLFQKNIRYFLWGSFLMGISQSIFMLLYNLYLKDLNFPESFIGKTLSYGSLGGAIFSIPLAMLLPRIRIKKILLIVPFFIFLTTLFQTFYINETMILASSFFKGLFFTVYMVISAPFFMRNSTEKERTYIFSLSFAIMLASGFIGNIASGYIFKYSALLRPGSIFQYQFTLTISAIIALLSFYYFIFISTKNIDRSQTKKIELKGFPSLFMIKITIPQFIIGLGAGLIIPFLNLYLREVWELNNDKIGLIFALSQAFMFFGIILGPVMKKYIGMIKSVVITQLLSMPFMFLLGYSNILLIVVISFFLRSTLMNMSQPLVTNFAMEKVEERFQFITNAIMSIAWTGAWVISSYLGGVLIEKSGFRPAFLIAINFYLLSSVLYYLFFIKKKQNHLNK